MARYASVEDLPSRATSIVYRYDGEVNALTAPPKDENRILRNAETTTTLFGPYARAIANASASNKPENIDKYNDKAIQLRAQLVTKIARKLGKAADPKTPVVADAIDDGLPDFGDFNFDLDPDSPEGLAAMLKLEQEQEAKTAAKKPAKPTAEEKSSEPDPKIVAQAEAIVERFSEEFAQISFSSGKGDRGRPGRRR